MSKFNVLDSDGKITNEARMGTGTIFHQISTICLQNPSQKMDFGLKFQLVGINSKNDWFPIQKV